MPRRTAPGGTVLVTGASSGIGAAIARHLAAYGYRVFGTSRRARPDEPGIEFLVLNMTDQESIELCVTEILARTGRIDLLVNNAGVLLEGFAEETDLADAYEVFATNLFGVANVTNAVLPGMRRHRNGRIITIGSLAAWVGEPGEGFYAASKAALARYTESLRHEVHALGIAVSLVEPGAYATGVLAAAAHNTRRRITDYDRSREAAHETLRAAAAKGGDSDEVARLVLRIARARTPRFRYPAGHDARWIPYLRTLLPQAVFDHLVRRAYGLPRTGNGR